MTKRLLAFYRFRPVRAPLAPPFLSWILTRHLSPSAAPYNRVSYANLEYKRVSREKFVRLTVSSFEVRKRRLARLSRARSMRGAAFFSLNATRRVAYSRIYRRLLAIIPDSSYGSYQRT